MTRNEVLSVLGFAECSIEHKAGPGLVSVMHINYRYNKNVPEEIFEEYPWTEEWQEALTRAHDLLNVVGDVPLSVMGDIVFGEGKPDMQYEVNTFPHEFKREIWLVLKCDTRYPEGYQIARSKAQAEDIVEDDLPYTPFSSNITHITWSQEWDQKRYAPLIDAVKEILDDVFVSVYGMCLVWPK